MIYPILLACVGVGSILILMNFVVPRFASVFSDSHMKIPLPTQLMLDTSKIVQDLVVGGGAGAFLGLRRIQRLYRDRRRAG